MVRWFNRRQVETKTPKASILEANTSVEDLRRGPFPETMAAIIRGESHRQKELRTALADRQTPVTVPVTFQRDPLNEYDHNAIAVFIDQQPAGFVAKELAAAIAPKMDRENLVEFQLAGQINEWEDSLWVDVWPERRMTPCPRFNVPTSMLRSENWKNDPSTRAQHEFIADLVTRLAEEKDDIKVAREALKIAGLPDLSERTLRRLRKGQASEIIDRLIEWEDQQ